MMALRKHLSGQKGFTLIELLVVVAILGILATVAFPRIMDAIDNARERKALADLTVLRDALERFYLEYARFPLDLAVLQEKDYIDPGFTFKNSYGNYYFYAVWWKGPNDPDSLKDYVLGDPGQEPGTGNNSPLGVDPSVGAHYWSDGTLSGDQDVQDYEVTGLNMQPLQMSATLFQLNPDSDPETQPWVKFKGQ